MIFICPLLLHIPVYLTESLLPFLDAEIEIKSETSTRSV